MNKNSESRADAKPQEQSKKKRGSFLTRVHVGRKDRQYFVENISVMLSSGMGVIRAIEAIQTDVRSRGMKKVLEDLKNDIDAGYSLSNALERAQMLPPHVISLIRIGEESGRLSENLQVVAVQEEKDRVFRSKIKSAMMYPALVFGVTIVVGLVIAWFILPRLTLVFGRLNVDLPAITEWLIQAGTFISAYGSIVIPSVVVFLVLFFFLLFAYSKTKFIGQEILFRIPAIRRIVQQVELARFGYVLGTLLEAGLPVVDAIDSLQKATNFRSYRRLYRHLHDRIDEGNSFQKSFSQYRRLNRLVPTPVQQLIAGGEQSGTLSDTLLRIGQRYETKVETSTKNLAVLLEPILLVIVWIGVVAVAMAVILPIYSILRGVNAGGGSADATTPSEPASVVADLPDNANVFEEPVVSTPKTTLRILPTGLGYLNVRDEPAIDGPLLTTVAPGDEHEYTDELDGWYEIRISDGTIGWIFGEYAEPINAVPNEETNSDE